MQLSLIVSWEYFGESMGQIDLKEYQIVTGVLINYNDY